MSIMVDLIIDDVRKVARNLKERHITKRVKIVCDEFLSEREFIS